MLEVMQILHIRYKTNNKESRLFTSILTINPFGMNYLELDPIEA